MWNQLSVPSCTLDAWDSKSTCIHEPPYFKSMTMSPARPHGVKDVCRLLNFGDSYNSSHFTSWKHSQGQSCCWIPHGTWGGLEEEEKVEQLDEEEMEDDVQSVGTLSSTLIGVETPDVIIFFKEFTDNTTQGLGAGNKRL